MSRPTELDLTAADQPWRPVPMPGANRGVDLVPLASSGETFALLVRFPRGFERATAGGYLCAEEFVVLDGCVEIEGRAFVRGDLTFVPPRYLRTSMRAPQGCTALAWFGGPAVFRTPEELGDDAVTSGIESIALDALLGDDFLVTTEARWSVAASRLAADDDGVDLALSRWAHGVPDMPLGLRRRPIVAS